MEGWKRDSCTAGLCFPFALIGLGGRAVETIVSEIGVFLSGSIDEINIRACMLLLDGQYLLIVSREY